MTAYFTHTDYVDTDLYEEHLKSRGHVFIDYYEMQDKLRAFRGLATTYETLITENMQLGGVKRYSSLSKDKLFTFFIDDLGLDEKLFKARGTKGLSLNAKHVLAKLSGILSGYGKAVCDDYMAYSSLQSKNNRIAKILAGLQPAPNLYSRDGEPLALLRFDVNQQDNLRYNYRDEDIISIANDYKSCNTAPAGYVLAWGDFAQSDWRIGYNLLVRDERNIDIMRSAPDAYEGIARVVADFHNEPFDLQAFKEERDIYKVFVLQTLYGQRADANAKADAFIKKFAKYLETCPRYMELYTELSTKATQGMVLELESYFGYRQIIGGGLRTKEIIDKGLNTPIQTGTSEIVILVTNAIMATFESLGLNVPEDVAVYFVRHDEPIFIMKEDKMEYSWVFSVFNEILVDDWTPLKLDFEFGYKYGVLDNGLNTMYKLHCNKHEYEAENLTRQSTPRTVVHHDFKPVVQRMELSVCGFKDDEHTVIFVYDRVRQRAWHIEVDDPAAYASPKECFKSVVRGLHPIFKEENFGYILIAGPITQYDNTGLLPSTWSADAGADYTKGLLLAKTLVYKKTGVCDEVLFSLLDEYLELLDKCEVIYCEARLQDSGETDIIPKV